MNRLANETSPYLRQHAENPVDWYPWGDEALARAAEEDRPLFVSIGYAACHWCHVMAHESFEDPEVAARLAESFISIKVDREERPDLDAIYMAATLAQNGSGGWPMSVFCTPDGRPFFAGTYFPRVDRGAHPGFLRVLDALADAWGSNREAVEQQAQQIAAAVERQVTLADELVARPGGEPKSFADLLGTVVETLARGYDEEWGGFGPAPKFPRPTLIELCLRHHMMTGDLRSLAMATGTLDAMASGGIYDHLAGGFARYSTDREWLVPHFEKMLTDQALLARAYLHAWQVTGRDDYRQVMAETLDAMLGELRAPGGGLCSSIDADAGGREGGHATFTRAELEAALQAAGLGESAEAAADFYGLTEAGNWESTNVLRRPLGAPLARPPEIEAARVALLAARRARVQPAVDDKVLTEWNAMAVSTLAEAAGATGEPRWAEAAEEIAEVLFSRLRRSDGRWLRSLQGDDARHLALAADYAWVVEAATRLGELTGRALWTQRALEVARGMLELFGPGPGQTDRSLYSTGADAPALIVRPKDLLDGALPSANAVAAQALLRLGDLSGEQPLTEAARGILSSSAGLLAANPVAFCDLVGAVALAESMVEIVVAGDRPDLVAVVRSSWRPDAVLAWGEPTRSPLWTDRTDGFAYVCRHYACLLPAADGATLAAHLADPGG
jgi:uncharacterized protein YyaL (SSP411 family)